jgi:hypothetical protein
MKRRLIFHFFVFNGFLDNRAIKIHLKCLKKYSSLFSESLFVLSVSDDASNDDVITAEKAIVECGFVSNVTFIIEKTTPYCEARTFYDYIVKTLDDYDGLTFFGHTKGTTNYKPGMSREAIDSWIVGLYFLSLDDVTDVEYNLISRATGEPSLFYGSCAMALDNIASYDSAVFYSGTFYWLNGAHIKKYIQDNNMTVPMLNTRYYAERFPTYVAKWENEKNLYSYKTNILFFSDSYAEMNNLISFLCEDKFDKFNELLNEIKLEIGE